jgi:hypothetical protein
LSYVIVVAFNTNASDDSTNKTKKYIIKKS